MAVLRDSSKCFACGKENPTGLQIEFAFDPSERSLRGRFSPRKEHEGWEGIIHGGIIATLMDEAMVKLTAHLGIPAVSAEITVRFRASAAPGDELEVIARVAKAAGRLIEAEATVERGQVVIGQAKGKLLRLK